MSELKEKMKKADPDQKPRVFKVSPGESFSVSDKGLFHTIKKDDEPKVTHLTHTPVEIVGFLEPIDGDVERGLRVRLGDRFVTVKRADVSKKDQMTTWLADHGVRFDPAQVAGVLRYFMLWHGETITGYTRNGWQSNGAFVAGETIIGGEGCVLKEAGSIPFKQRGSYDEWRANVLPHIYKKPGWVFGLLVGLSSPLLEAVASASGTTFNMSGMSSTGKTDALRVAAGAWGRPSTRGNDACVQSMRTTVNGIESLASQSNHVCLCFDEMKSADVKVIQEGA